MVSEKSSASKHVVWTELFKREGMRKRRQSISHFQSWNPYAAFVTKSVTYESLFSCGISPPYDDSDRLERRQLLLPRPIMEPRTHSNRVDGQLSSAISCNVLTYFLYGRLAELHFYIFT